uniref:Uncharacterized protein n=1 Tax=Plectus sambesii TaxID=2011161 RepID=A0A914W9J9_9BILA
MANVANIMNQLALSNNRKRVKISDRIARTNGASSNEPPEQHSNDKIVEKTGRKRTGSQVATDARNQASENEKECYFKHQRLNPDGLETKERPAQSKVTSGCTGVLRSFDELANSKPVLNLFGAENNADLALLCVKLMRYILNAGKEQTLWLKMACKLFQM